MIKKQKYLFIDRDGTLIVEPADHQIDTLEKFALMPGVIPALIQLKKAGFTFVMVSNQDGLGTPDYPQETFEKVQNLLLQILGSQGIEFKSIHICPHWEADACECRKPRIGLLMEYLTKQTIDKESSYVIGDRECDLELAKRLDIQGLKLDENSGWEWLAKYIIQKPRCATVHRKTSETDIQITVNLNEETTSKINSGISFFDHMLEQLAKHAGFSLMLKAQGDLEIDDHHTVEDIGIALGQALSQALGDKRGIGRYGFLLPMDEALATVAIDLSGRPFTAFQGFQFNGNFHRETIGNFSTELVPHFFRSFSDALGATLHIKIEGENTHHMIESIFKGVGRSLKQAIQKTGDSIPSTKGVL